MDPESGVGGEEPLRRTAYGTQANALFRKNLTFQVYMTGWYNLSLNVTNLIIRSKMITRVLLTSWNVNLLLPVWEYRPYYGRPARTGLCFGLGQNCGI